MRWDHLSGDAFEDAVEDTGGVCILPVGVLEYHGPHLPLGTDIIRAGRLARDVAEAEPAVVFPPIPFTTNFESKIHPGAVATDNDLNVALLENVCDEIARNGLRKILILNGHGGNRYFLPQFVLSMVDKDKDYVPFYYRGGRDSQLLEDVVESEYYGHAGEVETSELLYLRPDLVDMDAAADIEEPPRERLSHLAEAYTPISWHADQPEFTKGTPEHATAEKGERLWRDQVEAIADFVARLKDDEQAAALYEEFQERIYDGP